MGPAFKGVRADWLTGPVEEHPDKVIIRSTRLKCIALRSLTRSTRTTLGVLPTIPMVLVPQNPLVLKRNDRFSRAPVSALTPASDQGHSHANVVLGVIVHAEGDRRLEVGVRKPTSGYCES